MFSNYSLWISHFSDKVCPLIINKTFPLPVKVKNAFEYLKAEITKAFIVTIDPTLPLVVEMDASDIAIAATLNQSRKPVAFFSWLLSPSPVLMRQNVRPSKHELLVDEVELLDCNPLYAHVKLQNRRETTVSLSHQAPPKEKDVVDLYAQKPAPISQQPPDQLHLPKDMSIPQAKITYTCEQYEHSSLVEGAVDQIQDIGALPDKTHDVKSSADYNTNQNESLNSNTNPNHSTILRSHRHHTSFIRTRPYNLRNRET
ncbi:Hypothetical predicted protein [Octopus vulgaris]|uniref:Reverse transcriptase/retrotransposon-derived protein RNase H-like domain-containing protein n=1 Tax=Octopus vulgaris TaxID=6645 RepID=A0AA36AXB5_OCTVU|nr:Hypothetical predicted protein [Octopus vulgaris]